MIIDDLTQETLFVLIPDTDGCRVVHESCLYAVGDRRPASMSDFQDVTYCAGCGERLSPVDILRKGEQIVSTPLFHIEPTPEDYAAYVKTLRVEESIGELMCAAFMVANFHERAAKWEAQEIYKRIDPDMYRRLHEALRSVQAVATSLRCPTCGSTFYGENT